MDELPAYLLLVLFMAVACGSLFVLLTRINKAVRPERRIRRRWIILGIVLFLASGVIVSAWHANRPQTVYFDTFGEAPTADVVIRETGQTTSLSRATTRIVFTASTQTADRLKAVLLRQNSGESTPAVEKGKPLPDLLRFNFGDETFQYDRNSGLVTYERTEYLD